MHKEDMANSARAAYDACMDRADSKQFQAMRERSWAKRRKLIERIEVERQAYRDFVYRLEEQEKISVLTNRFREVDYAS